MFEFVCDRIIPGCTHVERGDTHEKALEAARAHMREHHGTDYIDETLDDRLRNVAIARVTLP